MRHRIALATLLAMAPVACSQSSSTSSTLSLLNSGDNHACSVDDTHKLLQQMLVPMTPPEGTPQANSAYLQAVKSLSYSYDTTTMDSYDSSTHSMTCSTNLTATIGTRNTGPQRFIYKIQPTSDSNQSFAISLNSDDDSSKSALDLLLAGEVGRIVQAAQPAETSASNAVAAAAPAEQQAAPDVPPTTDQAGSPGDQAPAPAADSQSPQM
jgi:hypothetical protein